MSERSSLIVDSLTEDTTPDYGTAEEDGRFKPLREKAWSFQDGRRKTVGTPSLNKKNQYPDRSSSGSNRNSNSNRSERTTRQISSDGTAFYLSCLIYAIVNVIISVPCLYGYAAVIFNHPVFDGHMNALSKLVIFSSLIHQLGFFLFSSLDFAIGTVQDAGLIFLSHMSNTIATQMEQDGESVEAIVSTTIVLLSLGTAVLGLVIILMGRFRLADAVSYLPMPVVGGYLAFIGYFCCQAGVSLCISVPMMTLSDWKYIFQIHNFILALPGLVAGLVLTLTSRYSTNSSVLPIVMVAIPTIFYLILILSGISLEDARESGWVGPVSPSVPVGDLLGLVRFDSVRWDLLFHILPTWVGMVFVVSFASCLDVAAISIDMGEALDTNKELATVGICNFMSGLTMGFTGSYIFSQTIFTYRTGVHSRLIGVLIMAVFMYIVISPANVLEISPLFFLGSALIFIGYDLMYEWLWEVRHQVFLSEYCIVLLTFFAIQLTGINAGIFIGVLIAIVVHVVTTAQASSIHRIEKRSRAVWTPSDAKLLHGLAYSSAMGQRIVTVEIHGTVFFGSALSILNQISDEIGLGHDDMVIGSPSLTPRTSSAILTVDRRPSFAMKKYKNVTNTTTTTTTTTTRKKKRRQRPMYLVLDLMRITHLDASAARGCFLQLVKNCAKQNIIVCAAGASPRIEWMFRSHNVSVTDVQQEMTEKALLLTTKQEGGGFTTTTGTPTTTGTTTSSRPSGGVSSVATSFENILLFVTVHEAIEFCETLFLRRFGTTGEQSLPLLRFEDQSIARILGSFLGASDGDTNIILATLEEQQGRYHDELELKPGEHVFYKDSYPEGFFVVLAGCIANSSVSTHASSRQQEPVMSGAGLVKLQRVGSASNLYDIDGSTGKEESFLEDKPVATTWQVGGIFGYNDFLLDRPRSFHAIATRDGTKVGRFTRSHLNIMQAENEKLYWLIQKILLRASTLDLANCTCHDV